MTNDHRPADARPAGEPPADHPPGITLRIIGRGDAFGSGGHDHTCFHLTDGARTVLLDCGASALPALKRAGVDTAAIDVVVLSHLHGDHFGGVPFLLLDGVHATKRTRSLTIVGPPGVEARVLGTFELMFPGAVARLQKAYPHRFVEFVVGGSMTIGDPTDPDSLRIETREVVHPSGAPSCAVRIGWNGVEVGYSGDTEWTDALIDIARGADLFICECYTYAKRVPYHLSYQLLSEKVPALGAKRMLLTHFGTEMLAHEAACALEVTTPGQRLFLASPRGT